MNQLYVQANKSYKYGFILTEQELRRLIEIIKDQIKKINPNATIGYSFQLIFQNGVVAETDNLDTILSQENEGSKIIISLHINGRDENENTISFDFINIDSNEIDSKNSIKYTIKSKDRDWVFVTSSQIEERINKFKRYNPFSSSRNLRLFSLVSPMFIMAVFLFPSLFSLTTKKYDYVNAAKSMLVDGQLKTTNDLLIYFESHRNLLNNDFNSALYPFYAMIGFIVLLGLIYFYLLLLYPMFNFCWGDYYEIFKKKENARKTFNTVIVIGLIISIIGGLIANKMRF